MRNYSLVAVLLVLIPAGCSRRPSDQAIANEIRARFAADALVKTAALSVSVANGDVTLSGTANSYDLELQAFQLARSTDGARRLHDQIVVELADRQDPVQPAVAPASSIKEAAAAPARPAATPEETDYVPSPPPPPDEVQYVSGPPEPSPVVSAVELPPLRPTAPPADPPAPPPANEPPPEPTTPGASRGSIALDAAGSTIASPLLMKWFDHFRSENERAEIQYKPLRTGGSAIGQLIGGAIDFAASDFAMTNEQLAQKRVLHFPAAISGVAILCNTGDGKNLEDIHLSGDVLAAIFLGRIRYWDHPSIQLLNPTLRLPANEIILVHRSDSSSTTAWLTDYLSSVSPDWKASAAVNWPSAGLAGKSDAGVAGLVKRVPFSIGYVEARFALENQLNASSILNRGGRFVKPAVETLSAAARDAEDFRVSIANSRDRGAYPIAAFTWLLVPEHIADRHKRRAIASFLEWMLARGNPDSAALRFAPLPRELIAKEQSQIGRIH